MVRGGGMERDAHTGRGAVRVRGGCWYYGSWHGEGCPRGTGPQHVHVHVHVHGACGRFSPCDAEAGRGGGQLARALPMSPPAASRCTIISSVTASPLEARPPGSGWALAPPASFALISRTACCTCGST